MIQWIQGECRAVLQGLPAGSVHCVVTSPPYWGLRDYGNSTGGIGLEPTLGEWVSNIVEVMGEVWRVLRDDGVVFLNLGDAYVSSPTGKQSRNGYLTGEKPSDGAFSRRVHRMQQGDGIGPRNSAGSVVNGLKPKDLMGQPWRVAFALQDAGWYLRSDIIWHKPNPMPESVQDRPTKSHEYVFLLTKRPRYFYDGDAVREDEHSPEKNMKSIARQIERRKTEAGRNPDKFVNDSVGTWRGNGGRYKGGRNRRSVWTIAAQPFSAAHFATFPPALVEPCILAGTSAHGVCGSCGAPWGREVEKQYGPDATSQNHIAGGDVMIGRGWAGVPRRAIVETTTTGWHPSCTCNADVVPATVLDPFGGAGTVALVADRLGRDAISIELNPEYHAMAQHRVLEDAPLLHHAPEEPDAWARMEQMGLFEG